MSTPLRLGLLQYGVGQPASVAAFARALEARLEQGRAQADLLVLPEYACVELGAALAGGHAADEAAELAAMIAAGPEILAAMRDAARRLGVWLLPAVAGGLIVRRPGAALFVELIAGVLEYLLGNPWGPGVLISAVLQGLGAELGFALFRWRRFGRGVAMVAGGLAALLEIVAYEWWSYAAEYSWSWKFAVLGFSVLSGVLLAGLGGHALVRALARAGALDAFGPGAEHAARSDTP